MGEPNLAKHLLDFDNLLKKAKRDFEIRWRAPFLPNATINDFNIIKTLGAGSFGRVVLVTQRERPNNYYAIKMLEKYNVVKTKQIAHTKSEIRIMDAFRFEFLVGMEYFFKDNIYLFLVMPFVNGGEMFMHLRTMKKFDEMLSKFYAAQVIMAFEYVHYMGIVYRDLKPENILIDCDGYIKITDYGFCKKIDDQRTYTLCGTPEYLAPEIIMSQPYNRSVDWWSFGILVYEMNAGYPPFYAREQMRIYEKIVSGKFQVPSHFSKPLKDLVMNILQVDRSKRYGLLKNGTRDFKNHEWFKSVDWDGILSRQVKPGYKPKVKGPEDTSNFDYYREEPFKTSNKDEFTQEFEHFNVV